MIVIPFSWRDWEGAVNLVKWMGELGGVKSEVLLVSGNGLEREKREQVREAAKGVFSRVKMVESGVREDGEWPRGPNMMFRCVLGWMKENHRGYFWWNEPDCIPLVSGWWERLEEEYLRVGKPFMGSVVDRPTRHLTGCAIYPWNVSFYNVEMTLAKDRAFDCVAPEKTLLHTHHTQLFNHQWNDPDGSEQPTFPTVEKLSIIRTEAVVFHRNKDHTLIDRLREKRKPSGKPHENAISVISHEEFESKTSKTPMKTLGQVLQLENFSGKPSEKTNDLPLPVSPIGDFLPSEIEMVKDERPEIYTYYDPITGLSDQTGLIGLWKELWSRQGWKPVVLNRTAAQRNLQYGPFCDRVAKFPTVNHPEYEMACYIRHLAMLEVGGGLMLDYDVMPVKFTPDDAKSYKRPMTILEPTRVPCALIGKGFQRVVDLIGGYKVAPEDVHGGKPHTSDMEILRKSAFKSDDICVEHLCSGSRKRDDPGDGWKTAKMIHFSTGSFRKLGWTGSKRSMIERALKTL